MTNARDAVQNLGDEIRPLVDNLLAEIHEWAFDADPLQNMLDDPTSRNAHGLGAIFVARSVLNDMTQRALIELRIPKPVGPVVDEKEPAGILVCAKKLDEWGKYLRDIVRKFGEFDPTRNCERWQLLLQGAAQMRFSDVTGELKKLAAVCFRAAKSWRIDTIALVECTAAISRGDLDFYNERACHCVQLIIAQGELEAMKPQKQSSDEERVPAVATAPAAAISRDGITQLIEDANYCIPSFQSLRIALETMGDAARYAGRGECGEMDWAPHDGQEDRYRRADKRFDELLGYMREPMARLVAYAERAGISAYAAERMLEPEGSPQVIPRWDSDEIDALETDVRTLLVRLQAEQARAIAPVGQEAIALLLDQMGTKPELAWLKMYLDEHPNASLRAISRAAKDRGYKLPKSSINGILRRETWIGHAPRGKTAKAKKAKPNDPAVMGQSLSADNVRQKF